MCVCVTPNACVYRYVCVLLASFLVCVCLRNGEEHEPVSAMQCFCPLKLGRNF